ncbi:uncharacterized protein MKZ38_005208 [Zalerion maritima]|uniref:DUF6536 domain-containing protein n=1 Tax=Zalerion maritima TaxID=339359 RepID=A0AAD5WUC4_9PEZI|nr:uncharacterized protein MKZ38_005208 [Zalerion maritima]
MFAGQTAVYEGSCKKSRDIEWGLFSIINVFVVILVGGANYVFQVMSSPTRPEVSMAHGMKRFLDIGVPSLRNLKHISNTRVFIILAVLLSATVTQVIYNSVIYISQTAVAHDVLFVTQSFLDGAQVSNASSTNQGGLSRIQVQDLQARAGRGELTNLTSDMCFSSFSAEFQTEFDAVILVTDLLSASSSLIQTTEPGTSLEQFDEGGEMEISGHSILYCLAQPSSLQSCAVVLNGSTLGIVALLNLISVVAIAMSLRKRLFEPLVTLGDTISSFLEHPDPTTRGGCLMTKSDAYQGRWGQCEAKYWVPRQAMWFSAPSIPIWFITVLTYIVTLALAASGLAVNIATSPKKTPSAFGEGRVESALVLPSGTSAATASILAALPHLLLAGLYLSVNSVLTSYFLSHEFSLFAVSLRSLRVSSSPKGSQSTSLFLTLPRPYSWALLTLFAAMGFVLSQSVFVMRITFVASSSANFASSLLSDAQMRSTVSFPTASPAWTVTLAAEASASEAGAALTAIGISGAGLLALMILLGALAALVVNLGFRRPSSPGLDPVTGTPAPNPLVLRGGSCSAVIAARCPKSPMENDLSVRLMQWGVLRGAEGMNIGHCGFSARRVGVMEGGSSYA